MFEIIKKILAIMILPLAFSINSLKCILMKNQKRKVREKIVANKPIFYPFSIKTNRSSRSCNNIINPHSKLCISDLVQKKSKSI